jgi:hypothetical protein
MSIYKRFYSKSVVFLTALYLHFFDSIVVEDIIAFTISYLQIDVTIYIILIMLTTKL